MSTSCFCAQHVGAESNADVINCITILICRHKLSKADASENLAKLACTKYEVVNNKKELLPVPGLTCVHFSSANTVREKPANIESLPGYGLAQQELLLHVLQQRIAEGLRNSLAKTTDSKTCVAWPASYRLKFERKACHYFLSKTAVECCLVRVLVDCRWSNTQGGEDVQLTISQRLVRIGFLLS